MWTTFAACTIASFGSPLEDDSVTDIVLPEEDVEGYTDAPYQIHGQQAAAD